MGGPWAPAGFHRQALKEVYVPSSLIALQVQDSVLILPEDKGLGGWEGAVEETHRLDSPTWTCCSLAVTGKETGIWSASAMPVTTHTALPCAGHGGCLLSLTVQWPFHHGGVLLPTLVFTVSGASAVIRIQSAAPGYEVVPVLVDVSHTS